MRWVTCTSLFACAHVCTYICIYVYTYTYIYIYVYIYISMFIYIYIYTFICSFSCMRVGACYLRHGRADQHLYMYGVFLGTLKYRNRGSSESEFATSVLGSSVISNACNEYCSGWCLWELPAFAFGGMGPRQQLHLVCGHRVRDVTVLMFRVMGVRSLAWHGDGQALCA